jgi:hypothetical protein
VIEKFGVVTRDVCFAGQAYIKTEQRFFLVPFKIRQVATDCLVYAEAQGFFSQINKKNFGG